MIASLRGTVVDKHLDQVVIECAGVGYLCHATPATLAELPRGEEVFVFTTMVVREDSQTLFAFADVASRETFSIIQSVSGVGARLALGIMSVFSPADLAAAVANGDVKALQKAPGVGKRLAERMAVDLKGKLDAHAVSPSASLDGSGAAAVAGQASVDDDIDAAVVEALVGLGFSDKDAAKAVTLTRPNYPEADTATLLKHTLAHLGGGR